MSSYVDALKRWALEVPGEASTGSMNGASARAALSPYGMLRDRLDLASGGEPLTVVAFAGITGGEAAGEVAWGYAESLVRVSRKVLFVDAAPADAPVASERRTAASFTLEAVIENPAAPPALEAPGIQLVVDSENAGGHRLACDARSAAWLKEQRARYHSIIMHVGPLLCDPDATSIARLADGVALVARARSTSTGDLVRVRHRLDGAGMSALGVILNGAEPLPPLLGRLFESKRSSLVAAAPTPGEACA